MAWCVIRLAIVTSIKHLLNHLAGELPWLYNFLCCTFTESVLIYRLIKGIAYIYVGLPYYSTTLWAFRCERRRVLFPHFWYYQTDTKYKREMSNSISSTWQQDKMRTILLESSPIGKYEEGPKEDVTSAGKDWQIASVAFSFELSSTRRPYTSCCVLLAPYHDICRNVKWWPTTWQP